MNNADAVRAAVETSTLTVDRLVDVNDFTAAVELAVKTLATAERRLGVDDELTRKARIALATAYQRLGDHENAIIMWEQISFDREHRFGPASAEAIVARHAVAESYLGFGRFDDAIAVFKSVLEQWEPQAETLNDHHTTLNFRSNLAAAYYYSGRLDQAIELMEINLAHASQVDDVPVVDRLRFASGLASSIDTRGGQGDNATAIAMFTDLIAEFADQFKQPYHPEIIGLRINLAAAYFRSGDIDRAVEFYRTIVPDAERELGLGHPHVWVARNALATALFTQGRAEEAVPYFEQAVEETVQFCGPNSREALEARQSLGVAYRSAGRVDEAVFVLSEVLDQQRQKLPDGHPAFPSNLRDLAIAHHQAGNLQQAIDLFEQAYDQFEQLNGDNDRDTLLVRAKLAAARADEGNTETAMDDLITTHAVLEALLGPDHHYVSATQRDIDRLGSKSPDLEGPQSA
ncbi:tetratricopeptide repeat protein [Nocardia salmonicida]|uniref:tetratricopeptide repeat protein n=1 Tax=Nocardia salmonicida TaxID=53431 RepID=UPI0033D3B2D2